MNLEKFLFAKIEAWILVLAAIVTLIGGVFYGATVRYVANGGEKAGFIGSVAYGVAGLPSNFVKILSGRAKGKEGAGLSVDRAQPHSLYKTLSPIEGPEFEFAPVGWSAGDVGLPPVAMMFRVNQKGDEQLFIFDSARKLVRNFPVKAESLSGRLQPLMGNSAVHMLDDGSVIIFSNGGDGLYRKDLCGNIIWSVPGLFHHSYSVEDGKLAVLGLPREDVDKEDRGVLKWNHSEIINIIDIETGALERSITMDDIARANAGKNDTYSWRLWRKKMNEHKVLDEDLIHLNKIELLSQAMADEYPDFPAGAWMLSSRNFNSVVVVHPITLEILWHGQGFTQGQHDPEFSGDNQILIFNNSLSKNSDDPNSPLNYSTIKKVDLDNQSWSDAYNAVDVKGYTGHGGELDFTPDGALLMNLTAQGRYLEIGSDGSIVSEFINVKDDKKAFWTKHAEYLTPDQFKIASEISCGN